MAVGVQLKREISAFATFLPFQFLSLHRGDEKSYER